MGRIPDEIIQKIRDHTDVVELIGRSVTLKRAGRNYKGLCPFHDEKSPSFNVNPDRQFYHCFGCSESGDAFSFLMKTENLSFFEAVEALAREAGVEVPRSGGGDRSRSDALRAAMEVAQRCYREALREPGSPGSAYLEGRGLDAETIEAFGLGFAPDRWDTVTRALQRERVATELGERAGLLQQRRSGGHYDLLRGRVTFPIQDVRGRVVAFGGRALSGDQEPKYLNTPESPLFRKRDTFYGFPHALRAMRTRDRAVVVEGYFDRIALHRAGVEEAVATCGTALTEGHARDLRRRTRNVVLLFDGDEAGQRAVERSLELLLPEGLRVSAALLPPGEDPDSYLAAHGDEALRALVDDAPSALDLVFRRAASGRETPAEKADAVASVAPLLARVPSAVERSEWCARLAVAVDTARAHVEEAVRRQARGEDPRDAIPLAPRLEGAEAKQLRGLALCLLQHPEHLERVCADEIDALLPEGPEAEVIRALVLRRAGSPPDLKRLAEGLGAEARALLGALAVAEEERAREAALRAIDETLERLRTRRAKERERELTRRLRDPQADREALWEEKQRLFKERQQRYARERENSSGSPGSRPPVGPA